MQQVDITTLKKLLPHFHRQNLPLTLWGKPSTGKTSAFRQYAQEQAHRLKMRFSEDEYGKDIFTFKTIIPSQFDPVDFIGMMKEVDGKTFFNPVASFPREGQGIFFIDEISNADHTIIAPLQRLVLEGRLENYRMPETFWRTSAGNRAQDFCQTNELSLAFFRRSAHLEVEPRLEEVLGFFLEKGRDPRVIAYLRKFNGEDLFPKVWDEKLLDAKANPFPYTWEMAANMIQGIRDFELIQEVVAAWVGQEVSARFVAFCKVTDKIDIDGIIKEPAKRIKVMEEDKERASLIFATVSILASMWMARQKKLVPEKTVAILHALSPEFATFFLDLLMRDKARRSSLTRLATFDGLLTKLGYFLEEE